MKEIWKDIPDYEGLYQVSDLGNVRSLDHMRKNGKSDNRKYLSKGKILKPAIQKDSGYVFVSLSKNGKTKGYRVHRLVAMCFINNPNNFKCVNHKDENKMNNKVNNLEWCSYLYNNNYGTKKDRLKLAQQKRAGKSVLQYDLKNNFIKKWDCMMDIERYYKIKGLVSGVSACCQKKIKHSHGYRWKYENSLQKDT